MDELLIFIMKFCSDLYYKFGFKFIDSDFYEGDNSMIVLGREDMKLMFIKERDKLFLQFCSKFNKKKEDWYSLDLVRQLITNEQKYFSLLDESNGNFIKNNLEKILALFSKKEIDDTLTKLKKSEKIRSKILFG